MMYNQRKRDEEWLTTRINMVTPIRAVYEHGQLRLLDPVELRDGQRVNIAILAEEQTKQGPIGTVSARDLLQLPIEERNRVLAEAAVRAEEYYRSDPDLTGFEAYSEHDYYDETP